MNPSFPMALSWPIIDTAVGILYETIVRTGPHPTAILGIARGGLVPGVMLSHKLRVPFKPYEEDMILGGTSLIVDDILDTMATYKKARAAYPQARYAVLVSKQPVEAPEVLYALCVPQEIWIDFPWEVPLVRS